MRGSLVCLGALSLMLSGCPTRNSSRYLLANPLPPYTGTVRLVGVGQPPPPFFDEIAILQAQRFADENPWPVTMVLMTQAASLGCDTILHFRVDKGRPWALYGAVKWTAASGTCVRVREAPAQPASPPGAP